MIVKKLYEAGLRSEHAYAAAFASIGLSFASWMASAKMEASGVDRADRWGIFVGEWAPTFFGLGLALARYEQPAAELYADDPRLQDTRS
ncbi:hypothetical protein GXW83_15810 [Streptacidiphilus sp. PB12-B1b]|uniref:hypothetical protein n=1 Tax=Streptacidiphilus sp. PB12-B1b TaxID=2705012 RepID=UPI0015F873B5|nr:hypothetical protein [Streptacidiphilus sp. PB12-B1b]QMU76959.1 hypothetical protein GXW83_15810 [Streptacidiphilus sp. PB12-B1b]